MKLSLPILFFGLLFVNNVSSQSPGVVAKFGIDADLSNDTMALGSGIVAGSHDWFKMKTGSGIGLIDTTGTSIFAAPILSGGNVTFTRGQSVARYAIVDGMYMLDTRYGRDCIGTGGSAQDSTVFKLSNKNGANPTSWGFETVAGGVQNKNDIVDTYTHMRRNGTTINSTNPSPLYLMAGASTIGTEGDRYIDFEFYKSRIGFNKTNGFTNSGSPSTGGHTIWTFNPDGTVKSTGDMLVSFNYSSTAVGDVAVYIWVAKTVKDNLNPFYFDFLPAEYYGDGNNPNYGYCRITQNSGFPNFEFNATANTSTQKSPFWGTNSKTLGVSGTNYAHVNYAAGQFSEIAINLTSLGIDPALGNAGSTTDPCAPPFTRIMIKTRASSSFTSELKDFTGPYPFLEAPVVPQEIAPANLTCTVNTTTLSPKYPQAGAYYTWSTVGGSILTNPIAESVTVSGEGMYYLTASIVSGCLGLTDSIILTRDNIKPVAKASAVGYVNTLYPSITANILGGDEALSNVQTPYGLSSGLTWQWSGPSGFASTLRDTITNREGNYRLIVTELRNGCKDTAYTNVLSVQTLPVALTDFDATLKNSEVHLDWSSENERNFNYFEVQRNMNGGEFSAKGIVFGIGIDASSNNYLFEDNVSDIKEAVLQYRLKMVDNDGKYKYSEIRVIRISKAALSQDIIVFPNPAVSDNINIKVPDSWQNKQVQYELVSGYGTIVNKTTVANSSQTETMNVSKLAPGFYILRAVCNGVMAQQKIIKQ